MLLYNVYIFFTFHFENSYFLTDILLFIFISYENEASSNRFLFNIILEKNTVEK